MINLIKLVRVSKLLHHTNIIEEKIENKKLKNKNDETFKNNHFNLKEFIKKIKNNRKKKRNKN